MELRVAAYCRVSTDSGDQLHSLESQRDYFSQYIAGHPGWILVGIYADEGISGTSTRKRAEFNRMITDAESGQIDLILTKEVSRFARNTVDTLNYTRRLKAKGIGVLFLNDGIDTRENDGEFRLSIMASVAQEESRKTSERVRWGQRRSMEQGIVFGNDSTFGFVTRRGTLAVREEEAAVIRDIFRRFVLEGKGSHLIAKELTGEGIPPPRSTRGEWSNVTILRILRNEKYVGDLRQGKSCTTDYLTHKRERNLAPESQVYIKNHHEAVVSREIFDRAQKILERRCRELPPPSRRWCSGILTCGSCGAGMVLRETRREGKPIHRAWICGRRARSGGWAREEGSCSQRPLDDRALRECLRFALAQLGPEERRLQDSLGSEWEKTLLITGMDHSGEHLTGILRKKERLVDGYLAGDISREEMLSLKSKYEAELRRLEAEQAKTRQTEEASLDALWGILPPFLESERVWRAVLKQIIVLPGELRMEFRGIARYFWVRYSTSGRGEKYSVTIEGSRLSPILAAETTE